MQEMNLVSSVAAESLGLELRYRPFWSSPDFRISLLKGKKTGHVLVGRAQGRLQKPHVCMIKSWLPPRAPSTNLKRQGFAENQTRASWDFLTTYRLSGAAWNGACWNGACQTQRSFLHGLFCPQNHNILFFPVPAFCEPKKEKEKKRKKKGTDSKPQKVPVTGEYR